MTGPTTDPIECPDCGGTGAYTGHESPGSVSCPRCAGRGTLKPGSKQDVSYPPRLTLAEHSTLTDELGARNLREVATSVQAYRAEEAAVECANLLAAFGKKSEADGDPPAAPAAAPDREPGEGRA